MQRTAELSNPFRAALAQKGWTVERGAAETGYSPSYFAMMVREPRLMSTQMRRRLADVLDLDLAANENGEAAQLGRERDDP